MDATWVTAATVVLVFALGVIAGMVIEAMKWRASAGDYRRLESGGRRYVVREDVPLTTLGPLR